MDRALVPGLRVALGACVLAAALALAAVPAHAATIDVTTTGDPGPGGTLSLRQAIAGAPSGSTIAVPAGTYTLAGGPITIAASVTVAGAGASATIVDGGGAGRVFSLVGAGAVELSALTVTGGRVVVAGGVTNGGGILADDGSPLTLRGVRVTNNLIDASGTSGPGGGASGGGIYTASRLTLISTTVAGNTARALGPAGKGGGIVHGGAIADDGTSAAPVTLTDSSVDATTADATGGAGAGGGIVEGGGIYMAEGALTLTRSAVTRSSAVARATGGGGGIAEGGGILTDGPLTLTNATISANTADASSDGLGGIAEGGGLDPAVDLTMLSSTVTGNRALAAGTPIGIATGGNIQIGGGSERVTSSIVSAGVAPAGSQNCSGPLTSGGHNLESTDQCGFHTAGDLVSTDALLGPLQDNGGPSSSHEPAAASPAVDNGDAATCPATDQRGIARPQGARCDIGSVERTVAAVVVTPLPPIAKPTVPAGTQATLPPAFGTGGIITGAPGTRACLSRRAFAIRIRRIAGVTFASAKVLVNGKQVAVRSGARLTAPINLRKLPKGRYTVKITIRTSDGRTISGTRRYRTCSAKHRSRGPKL